MSKRSSRHKNNLRTSKDLTKSIKNLKGEFQRKNFMQKGRIQVQSIERGKRIGSFNEKTKQPSFVKKNESPHTGTYVKQLEATYGKSTSPKKSSFWSGSVERRSNNFTNKKDTLLGSARSKHRFRPVTEFTLY